ncbi:MAG: hypothetical protein HY836_14040 [Aquabacterium sp.]|uniref:hypothetical protein n=1 Tax=Aquabacterium sp. TaxID=1872578 RepID=UPI0025C0B2C2|nr:hypothetical protein [Aquabacterium sp.]MBI5926706.1 hypothetical protein [Aquabacterium sp.]
MLQLFNPRLILATSLTVALSGCLIPEKFTAKVDIKPDASYRYQYQGTAVHMLAAMQIQKAGHLTAKDEAQLKADADKATKADGVKKLTYQGAGQYEVNVDRDVAPGQRSPVLNIVSLVKGKDDAYTLTASELKPKDRDGLMGLGIKVDGTVEVTLPPNAKVISQNATSTPGVFSKAYGWKVNGYDARPVLTFKLN